MNSYFVEFVSRLEKSIQKGLPGESAQLKMAPRFRKPPNFDHNKQTPKEGAVLILLYPEENSIKTLLIQRADYDGHHSSQVSFPGGKRENDESLYMTALRECEEEIGINKNTIRLIGAISSLYIPVSNFNVFPFLAQTPQKPILNRNEREVKAIIEFDLHQLNTGSIKEEREIKLANGLTLNTPCYNINGNTVWGATAMIISELQALINGGNLKKE